MAIVSKSTSFLPHSLAIFYNVRPNLTACYVKFCHFYTDCSLSGTSTFSSLLIYLIVTPETKALKIVGFHLPEMQKVSHFFCPYHFPYPVKPILYYDYVSALDNFKRCLISSSHFSVTSTFLLKVLTKVRLT